MKNRFKNALLSSVVLLASFGSIAKSDAQVTPPGSLPGMAWNYDYHAISQIMTFHLTFTNFQNNFFIPVANLIGAIKANSDAINAKTAAIYNELVAIKVNSGQTVANTNAANISLNQINPNILNVSNKVNEISPNILNISNKVDGMHVWLKEIRDYLLGTDGLGGISIIPWFDDAPDQIPRSLAANKLFRELYLLLKEAAPEIETSWLTNAINNLIERYSLQSSLVYSDLPTPKQAKQEASRRAIVWTTLLTSGLAERAYNRGSASALRLQSYLDALQESKSLKTSLDINTRVLIELAQTNAETLKMISSTTSMQGASILSTLGNNMSDDESKE